jgi:hypothetical protein
MNRKNLVVILLINLIIIAGTIYLIRTRYIDYKSKPQPIQPRRPVIPKTKTTSAKKPIPKPVSPGQTKTQLRNIQFRYISSRANNVSVIGDFNDWTPQPLTKLKKNVWEIALKVKPGRYKYNYIVDGKVVLDPYNKKTPVKTSRGFESSILELEKLPQKK